MASFQRRSPLASRDGNFGLTRREAALLRGLTPPWKIQRYLDALRYDVKGKGCRSPRRVLRERTVQCMDGALFAAAALRLQGYPPLIMDLEAVFDDDHVLAIFKQDGRWSESVDPRRVERFMSLHSSTIASLHGEPHPARHPRSSG